MDNLQAIISKEIAFEIAIIAINNIANLDDLVPMLLIVKTYLHMHNMDSPALIIIQKTVLSKILWRKSKKFKSKINKYTHFI